MLLVIIIMQLLSIVLVKHGQKVITGTQEGILYIFSWGSWGDCSDRFPGHPESVETMLVIDEETICTGSSDGLIRIVSILPNKLLGERWPRILPRIVPSRLSSALSVFEVSAHPRSQLLRADVVA